MLKTTDAAIPIFVASFWRNEISCQAWMFDATCRKDKNLAAPAATVLRIPSFGFRVRWLRNLGRQEESATGHWNRHNDSVTII